MIDSLREVGDTHGPGDLTAVASPNREVKLVEHAPNGPGAPANLLMNILARFDITALDALGAERVHPEAEATRLAFYARDRFLADADSTTLRAHRPDPQQAIDAPRAFAGLFSGRDGMALETGYNGAVHQALAARATPCVGRTSRWAARRPSCWILWAG